MALPVVPRQITFANCIYMKQALYLHALDLFNRACFFDAHEVWEDVWRAAPPYSQPLVTPLGALATQCATCCQRPFSLTQVSPNTLSALSTLPP